ncbi:MAG: hypothetical protein QGG40_20435, partial [Myxococcota bacterium]|nr:hypothetical protein [Myxococcota bacterium]
EGPFYLGGAPERSELDVYGHEGISLTITGQVTDSECNPRPFVLLDLWHADPDGDYDMKSHDRRYSALVPTDKEGRYSVHTLYPVAYGDGEGGTRASHVHLKVWVDGEVMLTSQWYFEGDPNLNKDSTSKEGLIISLEESADGALSGVFDFVV